MADLHKGTGMRAVASTLIALISAVHLTAAAADLDISGEWRGAIEVPGVELEIVVDFKQTDATGWVGTIDIPLQNAEDLPLANVELAGTAVSFEILGVPGEPKFAGQLAADGATISGDFTQAGQTFPFSIARFDEAAQTAASEALQRKLQSIRSFVDSTMQYWKVPGVGLAVVKDGEVILAHGFGFRNLTDSLPVTSRTLFAIGSSTKAFTTLAMGILVDDGLLEWDEPVRKYLPDFALYDEFASQRLTPRDLVTHRSGLPRHDLMWYNSDYTRPQLYQRLRFLQPSEGLRTAFQYQNLMYMTAGYMVGRLSGGSWEDFVANRIFQPLGMTNSNFSVLESQNSPDYALPYEKTKEDEEEIVKEIPFRNITTMGPAGSINSCVDDMSKWLLLHLNGGEVADSQLISLGNLSQMHTPQVALGQSSPFTETLLSSYGMGWFIEAYRGHLFIHHGGNIDGFSAQVGFLPNEKIGVAVLTNLNGTGLPNLIAYYVADILLDLEPVEWHARAKLRREQAEAAKDEEKSEGAGQVKGTKPSHKLEGYVGEYENSGYGIVKIALDDKQLTATYNNLNLPLEHWHYDVFKAQAKDVPGEPEIFVTFETNIKGDIGRLRAPFEPTVDEIEFSRRPPAQMFDPEFLAQFVGVYNLMGQELHVSLQGESTLVATTAGQPPYKLKPYRGYQFEFEDLTGFSVEFLVDEDGTVTGMDINQMGEVFTAEKKQ